MIGLMGFARVGKDTCARALASLNYEQRAFADGVRRIAEVLDPLIEHEGGPTRYNELVARLGYDVAKTQVPELRAELVKIGHGLRGVLGDNIWVDRVVNGAGRVVVSDVRYPNEVAAIKARGGVVIEIRRSGVGAATPTEAASLAECRADFCFDNDGPLEALPEAFLACVRAHIADVAGPSAKRTRAAAELQ
jgi:hypothetical protein